jgi:hypothetical protein
VCTPTATPIASGSATGGKTITTGSFTLKANTTYLLFAFTTHGNLVDSATFSSTVSGLTFNTIGSGSLGYNNNNDWEFGSWVNGPASNTTGTITVTFAQTINNQAYLQVVELGCNNTTTPIVQSAYASSPGTTQTNPYTANMAPPTGTDFAVYFLDANEDLKGTDPTSSPAITLLTYVHGGGGSTATFFANAPTASQSFDEGDKVTAHHWGTIAVEIKHF